MFIQARFSTISHSHSRLSEVSSNDRAEAEPQPYDMGVIEICYIRRCGCITVKAHQIQAFKTSTFLRPLKHLERYTKLSLIYRLCALSRLLVGPFYFQPSGTQVRNISGKFFRFEIILDAIRLKGNIQKLYFYHFVRLNNLFQGKGSCWIKPTGFQRGNYCARVWFLNGSGQQDSEHRGFCRASSRTFAEQLSSSRYCKVELPFVDGLQLGGKRESQTLPNSANEEEWRSPG